MSVRLDLWLIASRAYKTRTIAQEHCGGGHVKVNDRQAEPSTAVRPHDVVVFWRADKRHIWRVLGVATKRGPAEAAVLLYEDLTPKDAVAEPPEVRDRGAGRPTKRDGREIRLLKGI